MIHRDLIRTSAQQYTLDPLLVEAVVMKESGGNPFAWNPEPHYCYLWNVKTNTPFRRLTDAEEVSERPPADFPVLAGDRGQEWWGQQASWGLMQIMGGLGRELAYRGPYLPGLCDPTTNLQFGCLHLAGLLRWAKGDIAKALSAYNAGKIKSAQGAAYAVAVLSIHTRLTKETV